MDIKVNEATPVIQTSAAADVKPKDDAFKFTLASSIEDHDLQEKLTSLMGEIEEQGKKIAEHMDIRDMKDGVLLRQVIDKIVGAQSKAKLQEKFEALL